MNAEQELYTRNFLADLKRFSEQSPFSARKMNEMRIHQLKKDLKLFTSYIELECKLVVICRYNLSYATFITRWYWKKELYKLLLALRKYQRGKKYIESILNE